DVLIFLRRVLGEFDAAVRAPVEPFRMRLYPGVVRRALDREVEGNLEAMVASGCNQPAEVLKAPEFGMNGVVAARFRADGIGTAGVIWAGCQAIVAALAVGCAERMDGWEMEHVEAQFAHVRKTRDDVLEGAVPTRLPL